jgi:hypothetical protein
VVGVDGSAHGDAALRWALEQAETRGGQVTAVFAWQQPFVSIPGAFDREELEQAAKDFLIEKVSAVAPTPKVPLLPLVAEGDPAEALVLGPRTRTCWWSAPAAARRSWAACSARSAFAARRARPARSR